MNGKCLCCGEKEITNIKRALCSTCYHRLWMHSLLDDYPIVRNRLPFTPKKIKQYDSLLTDIQGLIDNQDANLQTVAEKHGCSRENIRQIFERLYGFKYTAVVNIRSDMKKRAIERNRNENKDPRNKLNRYKSGSLQARGAVGEQAVFDVCSKLNYEIKPYTIDASIDLVINNHLVEIKTAYKTTLTDKRNKTRHFHFRATPRQRKADFMICYAVPINRFFIIPHNEFSPCGEIFIPEKPISTWNGCGGSLQTRKNHWWDFVDAWHLLMPKEKDVVFHETAMFLQ